MRIGFDELDRRVLPDMGVKVAFRGAVESQSAAPRIEVPDAAIRSLDGRDVVFVVNEGKLERRSITLGERLGDRSVVAAGLVAGETIVVDGPSELAEGDRVKETG